MSDWFEKAKQLRVQGLTYKQIGELLGKSEGRVRTKFYEERKKHSSGSKLQTASDKPLVEQLLEVLEKKHGQELTISDIVRRLKVSPRVLMAAAQDLIDDGYIIDVTDEYIKLAKVAPDEENTHELDWQGNQVIRFGVVADTHLGSKWQQLGHLNTLYDIYEREGIVLVFHAGDLVEGVNMRRGHEYEVFLHGADEQVDYVVEKYPRRAGIVTQFITGNHDHSIIKHAGHDIGPAIARRRSDMVYLGRANAKVNLTPNCVLEINHPLDGAAYALSYGLQKMIDAMSGGEKPNIYLGGHHHKTMYLFYRNIHAFECGTVQAQTPWMRGKRIPAHMGGWIVEVHVDDEGTVTRCKGEFVPFYVALENDY